MIRGVLLSPWSCGLKACVSMHRHMPRLEWMAFLEMIRTSCIRVSLRFFLSGVFTFTFRGLSHGTSTKSSFFLSTLLLNPPDQKEFCSFILKVWRTGSDDTTVENLFSLSTVQPRMHRFSRCHMSAQLILTGFRVLRQHTLKGSSLISSIALFGLRLHRYNLRLCLQSHKGDLI